MNFGHGDEGFAAWPSAKSRPVAEYCTVLSASTPIARDASAMTDFASCAAGTPMTREASASAAKHFFSMEHLLSITDVDETDRFRMRRAGPGGGELRPYLA